MATEQEQLIDGIGNYLQQQFGDRSEASMRKLFDRYDVDHDGKITKPELNQLLKDIDIGNTLTRGAWVRGIIDKLDTNADKAISWAEFQTVVAKA
ncbi:MAG: EF-hand domain-containing protein [Kofleriaceae bacterium]